MRSRIGTLSLTLALLALPAGLVADQTVKATLVGFFEVPAISTTGHGTFVAKIRDDAIEYELSYADLEATVLFAHIHLGQQDVNGGVSAFLCGGGGKPLCPPPSGGAVSGFIFAADVVGPTSQGIALGQFEELVHAIRNGVTYANVHTTKHPGGEIRGQIGNPNGR